jgi:hypothetical protein
VSDTLISGAIGIGCVPAPCTAESCAPGLKKAIIAALTSCSATVLSPSYDPGAVRDPKGGLKDRGMRWLIDWHEIQSTMIRYAGIATVALLAATFGLAHADPAPGAPLTLLYQIEHPTYGTIGTYTNTITQQGDSVDVQTQLHVAIKVIGISLFHQEANRLEHWEKGRLIAFQGATDDNGKEIDINGTAQADAFVIQSPFGTFTAPARVHPSNPWDLQCLDTDVMMGTKTGKVVKVVVTDTGETNVTFDGQAMKLRQYFIDSDKHQVVWLTDSGVVAAFQTNEDGKPITFVLKRDSTAAAAQPARGPVPLMQAKSR